MSVRAEMNRVTQLCSHPSLSSFHIPTQPAHPLHAPHLSHNNPHMGGVDSGATGVINWVVVSVVLFVVFVQQLVTSLLYADSPFLIKSYFENVRSSRLHTR